MRLRLAKLALTLAVLTWAGAAGAQDTSCERVTTVVVTAFGLPIGTDEAPALADAVAAALNEAITRSRGVYVSVSTELFERFRSDLQGNLDFEKDLQQQLTSRFSGFVVGYRVLDQRFTDQGWYEVTVEADVCQDLRIALLPLGDAAAHQAIRSTLVRDIRSAGWRVVDGLGATVMDERSLLAMTFDSGVTYVARAEARASVGQSMGFVTASVTLDVSLVDTRTMQIVHTLSRTENSVGNTEIAAITMAGNALGSELARSWNQVFLSASDRETATFEFLGVNRAGTGFTLEELLLRIPGVLGVDGVNYDPSTFRVRITVEVAGDACAVARAVPSYRRVLTRLEACAGSNARFRVSGD